MTIEEFASLKIGDRVEILNLNLQRTGNIVMIEKISKRNNRISYRDNKRASGWNSCYNQVRVEFPLNENELKYTEPDAGENNDNV